MLPSNPVLRGGIGTDAVDYLGRLWADHEARVRNLWSSSIADGLVLFLAAGTGYTWAATVLEWLG